MCKYYWHKMDGGNYYKKKIEEKKRDETKFDDIKKSECVGGRKKTGIQ